MVEHVCPVGALTTKDFRFKARVWFLRSAKSVCQGCATGCNAFLDYDPRFGKVYRYRPRDNEAVNKFWMCDDGMLSYRAAHIGRVTEARADGKKKGVQSALEAAAATLKDVPGKSVAIVMSAAHSQEDNWAMRELARMLGTTAIYVTGAGAGYEDDILIDKDKNSNTAGVIELVPDVKSFTQLVSDIRSGGVTHVIALGGVTPRTDPEDATALGMLGALVTIAAHTGQLSEAATVLLPATSWAEASGTFVNKTGLRQLAEKAIEPQGASLPAWELASLLATALGLEPSFKRLKDVRSRLVGAAVPSTRDVNESAST